jgi:DNA mismatch repair ATPase MutS
LRFQELLLKINTDEMLRLNAKLGSFDDGKEFIDPQHPYASDLDIFGKHSLFQLLNRTGTRFGRMRLFQWLTQQSTPAEIQARQATVTLLAPQIDWRQHFQATSQSQALGDSIEDLEAWLKEPSLLEARPILTRIPFIMMGFFVMALVLGWLGIVSPFMYLVVFALNYLINRSIKKQMVRVQAAAEQRSQHLKNWAELIAQIESLPPTGPAMDQLQNRLKAGGNTASQEIGQLKKIASNFELVKVAMLHFLVNNLFFWDIFCLQSLEKWKAKIGTQVLDWFEVIGEAEALNSLAALRFAFPHWSNPEIDDGAFLLEAQSMGHPLIPSQQRIDNSMQMHGNGTVWLVTGSNMSGKSTFLRTTGINVVLALMGAPVCAEGMRLSPMQVVTSMRTIDSLEENTSSFYAELKRLKSVIDIVRQGNNVYFLLDEILKGTNSRDRQAGARALVQQLHQLGGAGLVSTHDIELVDMAAEMPMAIHNYSFNCLVQPDGQLQFDYKLTEGQCLSMNATALMRAMGIDL